MDKDGLLRHIDKCLSMNAYFIGMGDMIDFLCVELDAQILTQTGWRHHDQVAVGDTVAAYDGHQIVWTPLLAIHHYDNAPVVEMRSKSFRARVTPNHTWWTSKRGLKSTQDVVGHAYNLTIAAKAVSGEHRLTPDEAWLLGWLITDGHIRWKSTDNFSILQTKPQYVAELRTRLDGMIRHEGMNQNGGYYFDLHLEATRAIFWRADVDYKTLTGITSLPFLLSQPAREAMLDAMLKAEGTLQGVDATRRGNWRFSQSATVNPIVCEVFQNLCVMEGYRLGISTPNSNEVWTPRILKRERPTTYDMTIVALGNRPVWCPETSHGTWIMRQGQQIAITGNSPSNRQRLQAAALYDSAMDAIDAKALDLTLELYEKFLKPTKGRWVGLLSGHHLHQLKEGDTTDMRLCQLLGARFLGTSAYVRVMFNMHGCIGSVVLWCHHGVGGGTTAGAPLNKLERMALSWEGADVFLMGHSSKGPAVRISRPYPRWHGRNAPDLVQRDILLVNTGGWSQGYVVGAKQGQVARGYYPEVGMMGSVPLGAPIIKIEPYFITKQTTTRVKGKARVHTARTWTPRLTVEL